jgi:hypothetical protein
MSELLGPPPTKGVQAPVTDASIEDPVVDATAPPARLGQASLSADELDGPTSSLERPVAMATRRAARFATFAEIDNVGPEKIAQLRDDVFISPTPTPTIPSPRSWAI